MMVSNHVSKNTSADHLLKFYDDFSTLKKNRYDCLIITGAPVEHLEFEDVDYWDELCEIMEWSKTHVYSTLHICWGAQAGLYYHYHIQKHLMKQKVFGIYPQTLCDEYNFLTNGFDEIHYTPHSRHTAILLRPEISGKFISWGIWNMARKHWRRNISAIFRRVRKFSFPLIISLRMIHSRSLF